MYTNKENELMTIASVEMPLVYALCLSEFPPQVNSWVGVYLLDEKNKLLSHSPHQSTQKIEMIDMLIQKFELNRPF